MAQRKSWRNKAESLLDHQKEFGQWLTGQQNKHAFTNVQLIDLDKARDCS